MTRQLRSFIVAVLALLVLCAPARAAPFTPELERAYSVATRWWGETPTECSSLDREIVADDEMPEDTEGWATIPGDEPVPCVLYIRRALAAPRSFERACAVTLHEVGHLLGYDHSDDPRNVMYPDLVAIPAVCFRLGLRELNRRERHSPAGRNR